MFKIFSLVNIQSKVAEAQMAEFPLEPQWLEMLNEANEKAQHAALGNLQKIFYDASQKNG